MVLYIEAMKGKNSEGKNTSLEEWCLGLRKRKKRESEKQNLRPSETEESGLQQMIGCVWESQAPHCHKY